MSISLPVSGDFFKAEDFTETPTVLRITRAPEYDTVNDPKFGNDEGKAYFYHFEDEQGNEKTWQSTSKRMAKAFNDAQVDVGDYIAISRTGEGYDTQYAVEKVDQS